MAVALQGAGVTAGDLNATSTGSASAPLRLADGDMATEAPVAAVTDLAAQLEGLPARLLLVCADMTFQHISDLTGIHAENVRRYVNGGTPSVEFVAAISLVTGTSLEWLILGVGVREKGCAAPLILDEVSLPELFAAIGRRVAALEAVR